LGLFTPDQAFDVVAKTQIERLRGPSLKLVDSVTLELHAISGEMVGKVELSTVCPNVRGMGRRVIVILVQGWKLCPFVIIIFPF
jgi:hypothetical protein